MTKDTTQRPEPHDQNIKPKLNRLRAAVMGADDGILSVAGLVVGVAGATSSRTFIFAAGVAGILSGALSMAAGEYVSVSSQRDTEQALLAKERYELKHYPKSELSELVGLYRAKGLSESTAQRVAKELTAHDVQAAHYDAELGIDPDQLMNPWHAATASGISFTLGAALPVATIVLLPANVRVQLTFAIVMLALAVTGILSAKAGGAKPLKPTLRVMAFGALAMVITYSVGKLFNVSM